MNFGELAGLMLLAVPLLTLGIDDRTTAALVCTVAVMFSHWMGQTAVIQDWGRRS